MREATKNGGMGGTKKAGVHGRDGGKVAPG